MALAGYPASLGYVPPLLSPPLAYSPPLLPSPTPLPYSPPLRSPPLPSPPIPSPPIPSTPLHSPPIPSDYPCDVIERRACETFKNYRQHYVISRHVGGPLGDVSWQPFLFLESPWGGVGQFFLVENQSRIYPNMCAKFGCGPTVESKGGGGTDRQTNGHCSFI